VDVGEWLQALGLGQYEATFRENDLDAKLLPNLTADDLKELGITSLGHRLRLLEAITALRLKDTQADGPVRLPTSQTGNPGLSEISGERRQLTVMFCDLVGSTALSEKLDPEELRSLLHAYRTLCGDVIARYDGFVARYVGEGVLTYFGWPTAHEEDAERAVRAALEIVHTVKRASSTEDLAVRIGIATGPVVVGETAGAGDQSKLAVGSTRNLAARLQGLVLSPTRSSSAPRPGPAGGGADRVVIWARLCGFRLLARRQRRHQTDGRRGILDAFRTRYVDPYRD
jgi:class 3 adenylate cyclase